MLRYWANIHWASVAKTITTLRSNIGPPWLTVLIWLLVTFSYYQFGYADAAEENAFAAGVVLATLLAIFPFIYIWHFLQEPAQQDEHKTKRVLALEHSMKPAVEILFRNERPFIGFPPTDSPSSSRMWMVYRIGVQNRSTNTSLKNAYVEAVAKGWSFQRGIEFPIQLRRMNSDTTRFDIAPSAIEYVDVAYLDRHYTLNKKKRKINFCSANWREDKGVDSNDITIQLSVYGENIAKTSRDFRLYVDDAGRLKMVSTES